MDNSKKKKFIENNKRISELLIENESILKDEGFKPPIINYSVANDERIKIPYGYIRKADEFNKEYSLENIVKDKNVRKNISYALQLSDYYNFLLNRFNIWGSIRTLLYKQAFINIVSIIEALMLESANRINSFCKECERIGRCKNNISKHDRNNMKHAVEKLFNLKILTLTEQDKERLIQLYDYRNKVHIRLNAQNEFLDNKYNMDLYNEAIKILRKVNKLLLENAVPYYQKCIGYVEK